MLGKTPVTDIMSKKVVALTLSDSLKGIVEQFKRHKIKHMPVISRGAVIGMLSYSDVLRVSNAYATSDGHSVDYEVNDLFNVEQVMVKDVVCLKNTSTVKDATQILANREFHALPVVDEDSVLIGIVTSRDLMKYLLKEL